MEVLVSALAMGRCDWALKWRRRDLHVTAAECKIRPSCVYYALSFQFDIIYIAAHPACLEQRGCGLNSEGRTSSQPPTANRQPPTTHHSPLTTPPQGAPGAGPQAPPPNQSQVRLWRPRCCPPILCRPPPAGIVAWGDRAIRLWHSSTDARCHHCLRVAGRGRFAALPRRLGDTAAVLPVAAWPTRARATHRQTHQPGQ